MPAGHYAFLPPCSPQLAANLPRFCTDPPGFDRTAFHRDFDVSVVGFFREHLVSDGGTHKLTSSAGGRVMPFLRSEGTLVQQNGKTYWFKNDFTGVEVSPSQVISLAEGVIGRELGSFESALLMPRPFDGSTSITIVSMQASDPTQRNYMKSMTWVVIGYIFRRRENAVRFNYDDVIGTDAFCNTEGNVIGRLRVTRRQEPELVTPLVDPIDFLGAAIADIVRLGAKLAMDLAAERVALYFARWGARETVEVVGAEVVGAMSGPKAGTGAFWKFWRAGATEAKEFTKAEAKKWTATIKKRMKDLGIPKENIGIRGIPGESGEAFTASGGTRGANVRSRGISVHGNVMKDWEGFPEWNAADIPDRIDAIIAHEWMEFSKELSHFESVELGLERNFQRLRITKKAQEILAAMRKKGMGWPTLMDVRLVP